MSRTVLAIAVVVLVAAALGLWFLDAGDAPGAAADAPSRAASPGGAPAAAQLAAPGTGPEEGREPSAPAAEGRAALELASAPGPATGAAEPVARLTGRVTDRYGNPLSDARVTAHAPGLLPFPARAAEDGEGDLFEVTTDSGGRFEAPLQEARELLLAVRAAGFAPYDDVLVPRATGETDLGDLVLTPGAILRGVVVDADGRPVRGARLLGEDPRADRGFPGRGEPLTTTDSEGRFAVEHLACGPWRVRVRTEEHPDGVFEGLAERPGEVVDGLELRLPRGNAIAGRLAGLPADEVAGDLRVRAMPVDEEGNWSWFGAGRREADVASDGSFEVRGLLEGRRYRLQAREDTGLRFGSGRSLSQAVEARTGDRDVVLDYQPEATIAFRVIDARTGAPVEDMVVRGGTRWPMALRDEEGGVRRRFEEGRVELGDVRTRPGGDGYTVEVSAVGYEDFRREGITVATGGVADLGVVRLAPVPVVRVTVLDAATGAPIEDAGAVLSIQRPEAMEAGAPGERRISLELNVEDDGSGPRIVTSGDDARSGRTDESGLVALSSFQGETCTLRVAADGYAPVRIADLFLPHGELVDQVVRLGRGADVEVTVVTPDGEPVAGVEVAHRSPGGPALPSLGGRPRTDPDGKVRFEHLAEGLHGFRVQEAPATHRVGGAHVFVAEAMDASGAQWTELEVGGEGEYLLTLETSATGTLAGRITESGAVLVGAVLELSEVRSGESPEEQAMRRAGFGGGVRYQGRTDGEGRYEIEGVREGEYTLKVEHPSRRMPDELAVRVSEGENRFDADLPLAILEGRVVDPEGEPVAGAKVTAQRYQGERRQVRTVMMMIDDGGGESVTFSEGGLTESSVTDADGRYVLRGVTPDVELVVEAEHPDSQPARSEPVKVGPEEVRSNVDLTLEPGGSLRVAVRNPDGTPARFVMVTARFQGDEELPPETGFVGPSGETTLASLRPGSWLVTVQPMGPSGEGEPQEAAHEVRVGETTPVSFTLGG